MSNTARFRGRIGLAVLAAALACAWIGPLDLAGQDVRVRVGAAGVQVKVGGVVGLVRPSWASTSARSAATTIRRRRMPTGRAASRSSARTTTTARSTWRRSTPIDRRSPVVVLLRVHGPGEPRGPLERHGLRVDPGQRLRALLPARRLLEQRARALPRRDRERGRSLGEHPAPLSRGAVERFSERLPLRRDLERTPPAAVLDAAGIGLP